MILSISEPLSVHKILLILMAAYLACTAYTGYLSIEKLKTISITETERLHRYRFSLSWNILSVMGIFFILWITPIRLWDLGFRKIHLNFHSFNPYFLLATLFICGALTVLFLYQILAFSLSKAYRQSVAASLRQRKESAGLYEKVVDNLIPRTAKEKLWFGLTSLAAGICEEILFRGFLLYLLNSVFPSLPDFTVAIFVGLLFGFAHFYQGIKGIFKTAILGALFGFLYLGTNSLLPCMTLHFLFDISSAFLYETGED